MDVSCVGVRRGITRRPDAKDVRCVHMQTILIVVLALIVLSFLTIAALMLSSEITATEDLADL
jgi:hypothetical protein